MRKTTLSALMATGVLALAGVAQAADTFDSPTRAGEASTMTNGQPNALTTNSPYSDYSYGSIYSPTTVLGAGPSGVTTYTYTYPSYSYVLPPPVVSYRISPYWSPSSASETSNVPLRAGEASTMTGGVPNMLTNNY